MLQRNTEANPSMKATNIGLMRLKKELKMLYEDPPPGISAWAQEENFHEIEAGAAIISAALARC